MKQWIPRNGSIHDPLPHIGDDAGNREYCRQAEKLQIHPAIIALLKRRGVVELPELDEFLSPGLRHLARPQLWPGMEEAARILVASVREGREVLVWGDYDVDGVTAATLCYEVLRHHNVAVEVHLPDRREEGYGLNIPVLEQICADGKKRTLLTVDCGINDVEAVKRACELGMKVIVTDHHLPPENLPVAHALCNPRLDPNCPCVHLAGVGVAFYLMARVNALLAPFSGIAPKDMRDVIDLVGLGTLADMVSLTGQNRILAKNGLLKIAEASRPGIADLKFISGYDRGASLGAGQVVFSLSPRLNAAGRIGSARDAFLLLSGTYGSDSVELAKQLDELNTARRVEEERITEEAISQAEALLAAQPDSAGIIVAGEQWHQGVIGIVASRLVEKYYRPVLVLCRMGNGTSLKGSGRSVPDVDLHAALNRCADILLGFGGHRQAAGMSMEESRLPDLRRKFHEVVREMRGGGPFIPTLEIDGMLPFTMASDFVFLKTLEMLQPFGIGNPEPVFASDTLTLRSVRLFGANREHASLRVTEDASGITLQAKLWRHAALLPYLSEGQKIQLAFTAGINAYNGISSVELLVKDWKILSTLQ